MRKGAERHFEDCTRFHRAGHCVRRYWPAGYLRAVDAFLAEVARVQQARGEETLDEGGASPRGAVDGSSLTLAGADLKAPLKLDSRPAVARSCRPLRTKPQLSVSGHSHRLADSLARMGMARGNGTSDDF